MLFSFSKVQLQFLANEGIMIYTKNRKVLVDALHRGDEELSTAVDEDALGKITAGQAPYDKADLLVFTHEHGDHFDADLTVQALKMNPALMAVGPRAVTDLIRGSGDYTEELDSRLWTMDVTGGRTTGLHLRDISIEAAGLEHDAVRKDCAVNNVYLITIDGKKILHVGDAKASSDNFESILEKAKGADIMVVPFTYAGIADAREIITKIAPKKLIIAHMPDRAKDTDNWYEKAHMAYTQNQASLPPTIIFENPGMNTTL